MSINVEKCYGVNPETQKDILEPFQIVHPGRMIGIRVYASPKMIGAHVALIECSSDDGALRIAYTTPENVIKKRGLEGRSHVLINPFLIDLQHEVTGINGRVELDLQLKKNEPLTNVRFTLE